jgi:hypothetical protein
MRLGWQHYDALLPLNASARKIPTKKSSGGLSKIATRTIGPKRKSPDLESGHSTSRMSRRANGQIPLAKAGLDVLVRPH